MSERVSNTACGSPMFGCLGAKLLWRNVQVPRGCCTALEDVTQLTVRVSYILHKILDTIIMKQTLLVQNLKLMREVLAQDLINPSAHSVLLPKRITSQVIELKTKL